MRSCTPLTSPWKPSAWEWTEPTSGFITSRSNWDHRFHYSLAVGTKTRKIEIGTAVIDMRYENPHYMVEDAGAADLISGGRLQLGISRGPPSRSSMVGAILATARLRARTMQIRAGLIPLFPWAKLKNSAPSSKAVEPT